MSVARNYKPTQVRKTKEVGPDYPERNYRNPFDAGIDHQSGSDSDKTLNSPSSTPEGVGMDLHHSYDKYWEGK